MRDNDTSRLHGRRYPTTHLSIIEGLRDRHADQRRRAYDLLIAAYWRPVYAHLRLRWNKDRATAEDITQDFFALAFEKSFFDTFDSGKARFRTFVRSCVDRFASKAQRRAEAVKRGGRQMFVPLDYAVAEADVQVFATQPGASPDEIFERQWVSSIFILAVTRLKEESTAANRVTPFEMFRRYDLEEDTGDARPSYADLARQFAVKESDVTNYLAAMRRRFRQLVLEILKQVTSSEQEYREEARMLLGVDPE
jgi:DNA-directed RNA polymerase specialized sigma24 family protein